MYRIIAYRNGDFVGTARCNTATERDLAIKIYKSQGCKVYCNGDVA